MTTDNNHAGRMPAATSGARRGNGMDQMTSKQDGEIPEDSREALRRRMREGQARLAARENWIFAEFSRARAASAAGLVRDIDEPTTASTNERPAPKE